MKPFLIIFSLLLFADSIFGQNPKNEKLISKSESRISKKKIIKKKKPRAKTVSMGVVNGRALSLPVPDYPPAAKAVNVSGEVSVMVVINENGDVIDAQIISGHPLLRYYVLKAAKRSKFAPVVLSGKPVQVSGVIIYRFSMGIRNWVELGFLLETDAESDSQEIADFLAKYDDSQALFKQLKDTNYENRSQIYESLLATIRGNLVNNPENSWRFEVGLAISKINKEGFGIENKNLESLKTLVLNTPIEAQNFFFKYLHQVLKLAETRDLNKHYWQKWTKLLDKIHSAQIKI